MSPRTLEKKSVCLEGASSTSVMSGLSRQYSARTGHQVEVFRGWINRVLTDGEYESLSEGVALEHSFYSGEKLRELLQCLAGVRVKINTRMKNNAIR